MLASLFKEIDNDFPSTEVIVVDGGSTDETTAVLKGYGSRIASWISEPDKTVAEAVNKGISRSRGEVLRLIGDDDEFLPGHFSFMLKYLEDHPEIDVLIGHNKVFLEDEQGYLTFYPQVKLEGPIEFHDMLKFPKRGIIIPECSFFRRRIFEKIGPWDETFKYWGYFDYFMRITKAGGRMVAIPRVILTTYQTPESDSIRNNGNQRWSWEYYEVLRKHTNLYWILWHRFGGELTPFTPLKWVGRKMCAAVGICHPRLRLRNFIAKLRHQNTKNIRIR